MRGFNRIPSVVQIWLAEMVVLLFFSDPVIRLVNVAVRPSTGILKTKFDWFVLVPWAIGAFCLVWLMLTIFRPTLIVFIARSRPARGSRAGFSKSNNSCRAERLQELRDE